MVASRCSSLQRSVWGLEQAARHLAAAELGVQASAAQKLQTQLADLRTRKHNGGSASLPFARYLAQCSMGAQVTLACSPRAEGPAWRDKPSTPANSSAGGSSGVKQIPAVGCV